MRDLLSEVSDISGDTLRLAGLQVLRAPGLELLPVVEGPPQEGLRLGACVGGIGKYVCVDLDCADNAEEAGMAMVDGNRPCSLEVHKHWGWGHTKTPNRSLT
ncbi:MAG: hypothetical protein R8G34_22525 [Paracoccaceae bacterium]|nr:hypothetical protein [Paracoccaceae bacterium]